MKKVALSLAGLLAVAAFAPEASALPVFARQTGMACNACHFQHFPLLNAFGRSFKASGFTLMGAEAKVEGDNLSIPAVVNAAVLSSMGYEKTNATRVGQLPMSAGNSFTGGFYVAGTSGEASLFLGGRGSDFMGFLTEITAGNGGAAVDSFKTPILADVGGGFRAGVVPFTTNGQGASYGFETLNTGANAIHSITNTVGQNNGQYINAVSAQQYIGTGAAATGASLVAVGDMGFVNVTKFAALGPAAAGVAGAGANVTAALTSTYARLAFTGDMGGWDSAIGVQHWQGTSIAAPTILAGVALPGGSLVMQTKADAIDGQMQGAIGGLPVGFYASYARAPVANAGEAPNMFGYGGTMTRSSLNVDAEVGVIPEKATIGAAIRRGNSGFDKGILAGGAATGSNASDNAYYLTGTYKLAQNLLSRLSYVHQSGDYWTAGNTAALGSNSWTINLYALY